MRSATGTSSSTSATVQGAMDLLRPLLDAGIVKRIGTLKNGRYIVA